MRNVEIILNTLNENGGIANTADFQKNGLTNHEIIQLHQSGVLERIRHGWYQLADQSEPNEERVIAKLYPDGIICMDSALFFYGYSDRTPLYWNIAFPRTVSRSRFNIEYFNIKPYYIRNEFFETGKSTKIINGVKLNIYDRERTICDCFKYRNKIDSELFNKAVNLYVKDEKRNFRCLSVYAKQMNLYEKIMSVIGVIINE